jgi:uncharacterized protein YceK
MCLAIVLSCALGGCGTSLNLDGDSRIYGGVRLDAQQWRTGVARAAGAAKPEPEDDPPAWSAIKTTGALLDLPFSLVMDTVTLPVTIATTLEERNDHEPAAREVVVTVEKPAKPREGGSSSGR